MSRVTVFSKEGFMIGDVRARTKRSYVLPSRGVVGQCEFDISTFNAHARKKFLDFGKYILVRDGLYRDWIGVIYPPRSRRFGSFTIRAYQAHQILAWRNTPTQKFTGSAGSIFRQTLHYTNAAVYNEKPIKPGVVYEDKNSREESMGNDALSHIVSVAKRANQDFDVTYTFDVNGRLVLEGNWYQKKVVRTNKYFREGFNIEDVDNVMEENGDLFNDVTGLNDASTEALRLRHTAIDSMAIADHGLYQKTAVFSGVTQAATLQQDVLSALRQTINGNKTFDFYALNVGDTFAYLDVGNLWNTDMNYVWFDDEQADNKEVRILGMEVDDSIERVRVISEVEEDAN